MSQKRKGDPCEDEQQAKKAQVSLDDEKKATAKPDQNVATTDGAVASGKYPYENFGALCHVDIPAKDLERVKKFYGEVFSWKLTPFGAEYLMFSAGGEKCLAGGFYVHKDELPAHRATVFYLQAGEDMAAMIMKAHANGAVIISNKKVIAPGAGSYMNFIDTEGNHMSMYAKSEDNIVEEKSLTQTREFKHSAHAVFEMLMDEKKHAELLSDKCTISREPRGLFKCGSFIEGRNIEIVKDKKIVQSWRGSDWPKAHFSKVIFDILPAGEHACKVVLTHEMIPAARFDDINSGWDKFYWSKMAANKS
jgi:predicted enzyme related to lactoylglutathione lyase/uncharacterized protein YndB with AHSA1/START domain